MIAFSQNKFYVDILLDISYNKLKICAVNVDDDNMVTNNPEIQFEKIERQNYEIPWIPYILYSNAVGAQFRIAKIPYYFYKKNLAIWIQ